MDPLIQHILNRLATVKVDGRRRELPLYMVASCEMVTQDIRSHLRDSWHQGRQANPDVMFEDFIALAKVSVLAAFDALDELREANPDSYRADDIHVDVSFDSLNEVARDIERAIDAQLEEPAELVKLAKLAARLLDAQREYNSLRSSRAPNDEQFAAMRKSSDASRDLAAAVNLILGEELSMSEITIDYAYNAKLVRCVDGDTADFDVDLGFYTTLRIRVRFDGFDTPERGQPGFHRCTENLRRALLARVDDEGRNVIVTTKTGKYGRWVAKVLSGDDIRPGDSLILRMLDVIASIQEGEA